MCGRLLQEYVPLTYGSYTLFYSWQVLKQLKIIKPKSDQYVYVDTSDLFRFIFSERNPILYFEQQKVWKIGLIGKVTKVI